MGHKNDVGATKVGRQELIYTSEEDSRVSYDLPVLDEGYQRHKPIRNMTGANRISGYDGRLRPS